MEDKKKIKIYYGLLITLVVFMGVSYAWFRLKLTQTNSNVIGTRTCLDATLTEETSKITLSDAFPISDEDGLKQTPFTFTLKNNCDSYVKVYITIDSKYRTSTNGAYLKDSFLKVNLSSKGTTDGSSVLLGSQTLTELEGTNKGYILVTTGLKANEEKSYDLRVWMDGETSIADGLNKNWEGKIVVIGVAANEPATLRETILANNEVKTPLTTPGKEISAYTKDDITTTSTENVSSTYQAYYFTYGTGWEANGTKFNLTGAAVTSNTYANSYSSLVGKYLPATSSWFNYNNFSSNTAGTMKTTTNLSSVYYVVSATSSSFTYKEITSNKNITEALLASTEDDYGTSYYFRGAVTNNYVEFANKCWRIVRIAGDSSVKLVLHNDNTSKAANPCALANNSASAAFARYSGTTYKSAFNTNSNDNAYVGFMYGTVGASDYATTHANTNKSTILTNLETWYNNNLKAYESVIDDNVWCNDKTNVTDTTFNPWNWSNVNGLGYGTNVTIYGAMQRLVSTSNSAGGTGPSLKCNGELSKINSKVGLITADELAYAGYAYNISSNTTYLQENATDIWWWCLSPSDFDGRDVHVWVVGGSSAGFGDNFVDSASAVRPSISLISSVTISGGTGTSEDPYIIN